MSRIRLVGSLKTYLGSSYFAPAKQVLQQGSDKQQDNIHIGKYCNKWTCYSSPIINTRYSNSTFGLWFPWTKSSISKNFAFIIKVSHAKLVLTILLHFPCTIYPSKCMFELWSLCMNLKDPNNFLIERFLFLGNKFKMCKNKGFWLWDNMFMW